MTLQLMSIETMIVYALRVPLKNGGCIILRIPLNNFRRAIDGIHKNNPLSFGQHGMYLFSSGLYSLSILIDVNKQIPFQFFNPGGLFPV